MLIQPSATLPIEDTIFKDGEITGFREADLLRNNDTAFSYTLGLQEV